VEASGGGELGCAAGLSTAAAWRGREDGGKGKREVEDRCEVAA
jgi:hypothetical protein